MNIRMDAVYARQSVDKQDSISIESQIEFCKYELKGGNCKEYTDKGYSGKNTDRPRFQQLVRDIEQGLIKKVVVYKLDRISRSIIDFASMMELFTRYNVEFVSSTEKFDTSTPMGRAMLNICIVFAQLERETIQKRVTDAYYSRCQKGFKMGGVTPYGFKLEPVVMEGINTKMLVAEPEKAAQIKLAFEMYAEPQTSLGDIVRHFVEQGIKFDGKEIQRPSLSYLLKNPVYAKADLDIYEFFKTQGAEIVNDAADFTGTNGCYLYQGRGVATNKRWSLQDQIFVVAPHEGLVSSDVWLACRRKLMNNTDFGGTHKAKNTWLAGKIKCGVYGAALMYVKRDKYNAYFRCRRRAETKTCEGGGKIRVDEVEAFVYDDMCRKMTDFQSLTDSKCKKANPKLTALNVELAQVETEIEKLIDTLMGANPILLSYANSKIEELDTKKQSLAKAIADMSAGAVSPEQIKRISGHLNDWDNISFEDRRNVLDAMAIAIKATSDVIDIIYKF
ncbi:MAG: recombinase family protein [Oscillospiraceae bacterium]|nr:recombinase family protein [Oscillospiraceae bacterium]